MTLLRHFESEVSLTPGYTAKCRPILTIIYSAHTLASRWPGSVVLASDSEGHCLISSPNLCIARYVRKYFQTGEMPPEGTVCVVNEKPFIGVMKAPEKGEEALFELMRSDARNFPT